MFNKYFESDNWQISLAFLIIIYYEEFNDDSHKIFIIIKLSHFIKYNQSQYYKEIQWIENMKIKIIY